MPWPSGVTRCILSCGGAFRVTLPLLMTKFHPVTWPILLLSSYAIATEWLSQLLVLITTLR
jgi:hypothetical protein